MDMEEKSNIYRRWDDGFVVRRMRRDEEPQVMRWFDPIAMMSVDLQVSLDMRRKDANADDFYSGELNGELIASLVQISVADDLKYVSLVYVVEKYRRSGFARRMMTTAHEVGERDNWTGVIALDAIHHVVSMYEKLAYKRAFKTTSCEGTVSTSANRDGFGTDIREVSEAEFDRLMSYDDKMFHSTWLHLETRADVSLDKDTWRENRDGCQPAG